ncbi:MAG TPA: CHAD domain-containing protein, partial [Candidatus Limnocylindrales bacterium]
MTRPGAGQPRELEIELKYRMTDVATGERLIAADDLAGFVAQGPAVTVRNEDRYLDTPDGALAAAGYAGRLRSDGTGTVITLKGLHREDDGGAIHRREELEGPADPSTGATSWPASSARDAVLEIAGETALVDLVTVRQARHKRLYGRDGAVVEVSVDDVEVVAGGRIVERFAELELELRAGDERALDPLADLLSEVEELMPADTSKLERALEALRRETGPGEDDHEAGDDAAADLAVGAPVAGAESEPEAPRVVLPKSPGVLADDHLAEAGRKVLRFHLARMVAREEGTRTGRDADELHAMRVATRRQRAAWRVFGDAFDSARTAKHRSRLKAVAADLGVVRDLDVLILAAEAYRDRQAAAEAAAFE